METKMIIHITYKDATNLYDNLKVFPFLPDAMQEKITAIMNTRDELVDFVMILPAYVAEFDIKDNIKLAGARSIISDLLKLDINGLFDGDTSVHCKLASIGMMFEFIENHPDNDHGYLEKMMVVHSEILWRVRLLINNVDL